MKNGIKEERYVFGHLKFDEMKFVFILLNFITFFIFKFQGVIILSVVISLYMLYSYFVLNFKFNNNQEISLKKIECYDNLYTYKIIEIISVILIFLIYLFFIIKENKEIIFNGFIYFLLYVISNIILFKLSNILFEKYDKLNGETKVVPIF